MRRGSRCSAEARTGRTTTEGASGVFTLCGIDPQKLVIKIWKINVPASFGAIINVFHIPRESNYLRVAVHLSSQGFVLVGGHIEAELGRRVP